MQVPTKTTAEIQGRSNILTHFTRRIGGVQCD